MVTRRYGADVQPDWWLIGFISAGPSCRARVSEVDHVLSRLDVSNGTPAAGSRPSITIVACKARLEGSRAPPWHRPLRCGVAVTPADDLPRMPLRGRPSKEDAALLRRRILATALTEFRQRGYAGSGIEGIARAAGVSRTTIYALYCDKPTLFTEMIRATIVTSDLSRWVDFDDRSPEIILREAFVALSRVYYREPNFEIIRLCIAEADRFPDLFEQVRSSLGTTLNGLRAYLTRLLDAGRLAITDVERAAILFNMLALGSLKPFFVSQKRLTQEDRDGHIELALHVFLHGCLAPRSAEP